MKKTKKLKLSQAIDSNSLTKTSIILSSRSINLIDNISAFIARQILTIDFSNNYIIELVQMTQFSKLQFLNITNNKINNGKELINLYKCLKLKKIHLCDNPFLEKPLEQQVLQFILEKDTDIEILSGSALESIKQIQNGQLKLIFLENYKKKINCHNQLLRRVKSNENYSRPQNREEIINRMIPEYYQRLENSDIKRNIKKEAIQIKKNHLSTIQQAIQLQKINQQKLVENLITDIVALVEQQDKLIQKQYKPEQVRQLQNSKMIQSKLDIKESRYILNESKRLKTSQYLNTKRNQLNQNLIDQDNNTLKKIIKKSKSPENIKRKYSIEKSPERRQFQKPSPERSTHNKEIKIIPQLTQLQVKQQYNEVIKELISPVSQGSHPNFTTFEISSINDIINYETMYYKNLVKINPIYSLLYSPISSLKNSQKQQLLQSLSKNHKEVTMDLYRQKSISLQLRRQLKNMHEDHLIQINRLAKYLKDNKGEIQKKQYQNLITKKQIERLTQTLKNSFDKIKYLQTIISQKQNKIIAYQRDYQRLQYHNKTLVQTIEKNQCQSIFDDLITTKRDNRIKKQYFMKITRIAHTWHNFAKIKNRNNQKMRNQLKLFGWMNILKNKQLCKGIKERQKRRNFQLLSFHFNQWKVEFTNYRKQKILKSLYFKSYINHLFQTIKKSLQVKKEHQSKNKLADKLFYNKVIEKIIKFLKIQRRLTKSKQERSYQYYLKIAKKKYFNILNNQVNLTKNKLSQTQSLLLKMYKNALIKKLLLKKQYKLIINNKDQRLIKQKIKISFKRFIKSEKIIEKKLQIKIKNLKKIISKQSKIQLFQTWRLKRQLKFKSNMKIIQVGKMQIKTFFFQLKNYKRQNKLLKQKNKQLKKLIYHKNQKQYIFFFNNCRIRLLKKKNLIQTLSMTDKYLRRQKQWLNKITIQEQKIQSLVEQLNTTNQMLLEAREKQLILLKQSEELHQTLQYKNRLVMTTDAEVRNFKQDLLNLQGKHTELLKNYCQTIDYISKKDQQERHWYPDNTTIDHDILRQSSRRKSVSPFIEKKFGIQATSNLSKIRILPTLNQDIGDNNKTKLINTRKNTQFQSNFYFQK